MELNDIYDENRNLTGKLHRRGTPWKPGEYAESAGYAEINDKLVGPNAIAFGHSDAVAPARILANFAKDHEALVIKAGIVEGKVLEVEEINEIAKLPGREGMYSMLLGMLQAPVSKFARVVKAVADAREENGGEAPVEAPAEEKVEEAAE